MVALLRERLRELAVRAGLAGVPEPVVLVVAAIAVVVCGLAAVRTLQAYPSAAATAAKLAAERSAGLTEDPPSPDLLSRATPGRSAEPTCIVVDVTGKVRRPGVYRLKIGSRASDALSAAGGALPGTDCSAVNLARVVKDGEQIVVGAPEPSVSAPGTPGPASPGRASGGANAPAGGKLDLNQADEAALDALPGIGPATAKKIVEDRESNGAFGSAEDLMRVPGIGPKKFDALKDLITAGP